MVAAASERLVALVGTQPAPVANLQFCGIRFTQSLPTFLGGTFTILDEPLDGAAHRRPFQP